MGSGQTCDQDLRQAIESIRCSGGAIAEIGVWTGTVFKRLCKLAKETGRVAHAFDSWHGMKAPAPEDDAEEYPKGSFDIGGPDAFLSLMANVDSSLYRVHAGFIPDCFDGFEEPLAYAYVDLDQYEPTTIALPWAWQRLLPGGVLMLDDYCPVAAAGAFLAIAKWLPSHVGRLELLRHTNDQLVFRKLW